MKEKSIFQPAVWILRLLPTFPSGCWHGAWMTNEWKKKVTDLFLVPKRKPMCCALYKSNWYKAQSSTQWHNCLYLVRQNLRQKSVTVWFSVPDCQSTLWWQLKTASLNLAPPHFTLSWYFLDMCMFEQTNDWKNWKPTINPKAWTIALDLDREITWACMHARLSMKCWQ